MQSKREYHGVDFFDIVFLYRFTQPDFDYLEAKTEIKNDTDLKIRLKDFIKNLDLKEVAEDEKPFLRLVGF